MQNKLLDKVDNSSELIPHSKLGITVFVLALLSLILLIISFLAYCQVTPGSGDFVAIALFFLGFIAAVILSLVSLIIGCIILQYKHKKHTYTKLGISLSVLELLVGIIVILMLHLGI
ncbi:hypothetical protein AwWohl_09310 [Gammaproteobacteria bacterium]|nr:hypothetical protein AwWohl_09310 [Gammaproteobacteria bacterium]